MRLADALGDLVDIPQFFIWRLTWLPEKHKYEKTPCYPSGSHYIMDAADPKNWMNYQTAIAVLADLRRKGGVYALGWYMTAEAGYWFIDLDAVVSADGVISETATWFLQAFPGAFTEFSSSGTGLHIVGRGHVPEHGCKNSAWPGLELYTEGRGIAFGLTDEAEGNADTDHSHTMRTVAPHFFPYVPVEQRDAGPRPEWRGPTDDAELLRRALNSASLGSMLEGKASFRDLWERNVSVLAKAYPHESDPYGESEADGGLAMQLAFWTGCDGPRIARLMHQSALKRDKWDERRRDTTYLGLTIDRACSRVSRVLVDKEPPPPLSATVSEEQQAVSQGWIDRVTSAEEDELRNVVIPGIAADPSIVMLDRDRLAVLVKERLALFQIPATIKAVRLMLGCAKAVDASVPINPEAPPFASEHVFVERSEGFFHPVSASELSRTAFNAKFDRFMPEKQNGDREDAAKWCLQRWNMATVHDLMYVPQYDRLFNYQGRVFGNLYTPMTLPEVTPFTTDGVEGIQTFARLLEAFCGRRQEVYGMLLAWMAFNVQNPGIKVRWAPILKGVQGDGKSLITSVMAAAMGERNVSSVGPSVVMNTGGFTDWAHGACVIGMEELKMDGKQRYAMANAFKDNVTNSRVTINRKGKGLLPIINISNFIAYTNFVDAVPLEDNDRRWFVIFSPYRSALDAAIANGVLTVDDLGNLFDKVFLTVKDHPGQIRKWLLEMPVPDWFKPNGHAPDTPEKQAMRLSGQDEDHAIARQVIATGAFGVSEEVLSSACLTKAMRAVCLQDGIEIPQAKVLHKMIGDLGFSSCGSIKWRGTVHRVWSVSPLSKDELRDRLDRTVTV